MNIAARSEFYQNETYVPWCRRFNVSMVSFFAQQSTVQVVKAGFCPFYPCMFMVSARDSLKVL